jgi:hypothetical protein
MPTTNSLIAVGGLFVDLAWPMLCDRCLPIKAQPQHLDLNLAQDMTHQTNSHIKGIQELCVGYDHQQHIFLAADASFEAKGEAIDYMIDCFNRRTTGKVTCTHASKQHYDDSDDTIF